MTRKELAGLVIQPARVAGGFVYLRNRARRAAFRCRWSDSHTGALLLHAWLPPSPEGCVRHGWLWATPCIVRASNHPKIRGHRPRGMMRRLHLSGCSAACRCCFLFCLLWLPHSPSLCHGGFGLRNAKHHAVLAYPASWTSWAARRDRASAQALTRFSDGPGPLPDAVAANKLQASTPLRRMLCWPLVLRDDDSADRKQRSASRTVDEFWHRLVLHALLRWTRSRAFTPRYAAIVFTTRPARLSCLSARRSSACCSRLRLSLLLTSAHCRCRQLHDLVGDI